MFEEQQSVQYYWSTGCHVQDGTEKLIGDKPHRNSYTIQASAPYSKGNRRPLKDLSQDLSIFKRSF